MTKLVMVRHGQSQANLDNRFTGWSDVPLTAKGIAQGKKVGAELAAREFNFTDVHTSYMKRAIPIHFRGPGIFYPCRSTKRGG